MTHKYCPYCKKKNLGYVGKSIVFCCGGKKGEYYECERCGIKWKEITKEVLVKRERLK